MKIGGKYEPRQVVLRHWHKIVPNTIAARKNLEKDLKQMSKECLPKALMLKATLASLGVTSPIFDDICEVIKKRSQHIQSAASMSDRSGT